MLDTPPTPARTLTRAREIAMKNGLHHCYTGNVHDKEGGSTYCATCGQLLIGRNRYVLSEWNLTTRGQCISCGAKLAGVFEEAPGTWGPRRVQVRLRDFAEDVC
jgi:pyruvate formate lyase activating enzyme